MKLHEFASNEIWKIDVIFKILSTAKKLHDISVCHFDLKELNIFMMNSYTPILGDLGLIRTIRSAKLEGFKAGTPLYLGYNIMKRKKSLYYEQCKDDIFALGVILYQIIYG